MKKEQQRTTDTAKQKRFQFRSIQSKIALLLTLSVVLSSAIVGAIFISEISSILHDDAEKDMVIACNSGAESINARLGKIEDQVKTMRHYAETALEDPAFLATEESRAQFLNDFETIAKNHGSMADGVIGVFSVFDYEALDGLSGAYGFSYKTDEHGHFIADPTVDLGTAAKETDWYKTPAMKKKGAWVEAAPHAVDSHRMAFVSPILTPNGTCVGVVGVSCSTAFLRDAAEGFRSFETGFAFLLNADSTILYHPRYIEGETSLKERPEFHAVEANEEAIRLGTDLFEYRSEGELRYLSCITLQNGKKLCISASQNEILTRQTSLMISSVFIVIGIVVLSLLAAILFARRMTRPIKALNVAAREMLEGKLDTELVPTTADEIGELTRILNRARERIRYQISDLYSEAHQDGLTGVANKNAFSELEREIDRQIEYGTASYVLAVLDVNRLKVTNDFYGHTAGDELLRAVANHLKGAFGPQCVYRVGGDEFVVVLQGADMQENAAALERSLDGISSVRLPDFPEVPVSCAAGIVTYDRTLDMRFHETLVRADRLMYRNKGETKRLTELPEGSKGLKQLQTEKFLEFLSILNTSTDDYSFLYEIESDKLYFYNSFLERYAIPAGEDGTTTLGRFGECVHPADRAAFRAELRELSEGKKVDHNVSYRLPTHDGNYVWFSCRGRIIKTEEDQPFLLVGQLSDTALRPWYSPVTGLFNRNRFLQDMQSTPAPSFAAFMLVDIDSMSSMNLKLGRKAGDGLLRLLAKQLEEVFPTERIYHMEKDRFAILLPTVDEEEIKARFARLLALLGDDLSVSAAVIPRDDSLYTDPNSIYEYANQLLKENKSQKAGTISFFTREDFLKKVSSIDLLNEMRQSVANGFEGFFVVYQPQIAASGYGIAGAEALLRYRSPSRGVVSPVEFIPLLEHSRLINKVGLFVCDTALRQCREWRKSMPDFRVAVNFSTIQMMEDETDEQVLALLASYDLPGEALTIELTESIKMESAEVAEAFERFRAAGIRIAIDDFGTGYANLAYLKQIHADEIKIDRIFIKDIRASTYNYMVISNILEFAKQNGFHVCLEGVESAEELSILDELGADTLQGYLFDRPIEPEAFSELYVRAEAPQWSFIQELMRHKEKAQLIRFNARDILSNIDIGLWVLRMDTVQGTYKLFGDDCMHTLLGVDTSLTPEEFYAHWHERIKPGHEDAVGAMVKAMSESDKICQAIYPWMHPTLGEIVVRSTGRCTRSEDGAVIFEGFHRRIADAGDVYTNLN